MTLPTPLLLPGGGSGSSSGDDGNNDNDRDNFLRGVPLRQRQLPASFWQEPNVPRFYPPPPPGSGITIPSMPEYVAMPPVPRPAPEYSWATVHATAYSGGPAADYGYGSGNTALAPLQCSCPHCTEKHLRGLAASQVAYPWNPEGEVSKSRLESGAWMWSATTPKGPTTAFVQASPYSTTYAGNPAATPSMEPSESYVSSHQAPLWKPGTTPVSSGSYLPLPYSFN